MGEPPGDPDEVQERGRRLLGHDEEDDRVPGVLVALDPDADVDAFVQEIRERDDVGAAARLASGLRRRPADEDEPLERKAAKTADLSPDEADDEDAEPDSDDE